MSPESGPPPPDSTSMPKPLFDHARDELVDQRLKESTTLKSHQDLEKPTVAERVYTEQETKRLVEEAAQNVEKTGKTKIEIIREAAEGVVESQLELAMADAAAAEARLEGQGKGKIARFINKYRHSKKMRIGIAVAATAGAVGLAVSGLGAAAIGLKLAHGGLRGAAAYLGAREGIDKVAAMKDYRSEKKIGPKTFEAGRLHIPEVSNDDMLKRARELAAESPREVITRMVELQSPHNKANRPEDQAERSVAWLEALRQAEVERVQKQLNERVLNTAEGGRAHFRADVLKKLPDELNTVMSEHMVARREQIREDKRSLRLRKGSAILVGAAAFGSGAVGWLVQGAEHAKDAASAGLSKEDLVMHRAEASDFGPAGEVYTQSETIVDHINPGESPADAAGKHFKNVKEYLALDPDKQKLADHDLAQRITRTADGERWRVERKDMAEIIKKYQ